MRVDNYSCSYNRHLSCRRLIWIAFSRCLTFFIPDFILCYVGGMKTSASRNAWREKIAILFLFLLSAGFFCVWLEFISSYFCDPDKTYEYNEVFANDSKMAAIHGKAVDWRSVDSSSPSFATKNAMVQWVNQYPHHDLSNNFPTFMVLNRPSNKAFYADSIVNDCVFGQNKAEEADAWLDFVLESNPGYTYETISNVKQLLQCPMPNQPNVTGSPCFYGPEVEAELSMLPVKGDVEYDPNVIYKLYNGLPSSDNSTKQAYVILDGYVLDVTTYLTGATNIIPLSSTLSSRSFALDRMFLPLDLTMFLYINLGKDISEYFEGNVTENAALYRNCLIHLFRKGVVPSYISSDCRRINPALWATMGVGLIYFLIKMNLAQLFRATFIQKRCLLPSLSIASSMAHINTFSHVNSMQEQHQQPWPYVVLMIPCFSESAETLKQTIDSVSRTTYDDRSKILVFICDGVTISAQERIETHILLLQYLGYSRTEKPWPQPYSSLGQHQKRFNCACVYSGFFETGRNRVPYLVIVKVGQEQEQEKYSQKGQQQQQQQQQEKEKSSQLRQRIQLLFQRKTKQCDKMADRLAPPGNRGKRDSLLILFSFLERCSNLADNLMTPLDYEIFNQCYNVLGIDPRLFKYVMVTDADIQIQNDVVQRLVLRLEQDPNMLAISGHVRPANPEENLTTMLQIFPIYMTYFSAFAFEACLKSVMTINGGLVMYRVWKETDRRFTLQQQQPKHDTPFWKKFKAYQHSVKSRACDVETFPKCYNGRQSLDHQGDGWPAKMSDEIIITNPFQDPFDKEKSRKIGSSSDEEDESIATTTTATTTAAVTAHPPSQLHFRQHPYMVHPSSTGGHPRSTVQDQRNPFADTAAAAAAASVHHGMRPESRFIFGKTLNRQLCCVHPTVIRGFSTPQANTMHRANVLLLGEDKILPLLLLKSHPRHHLGFEPEAVGYTTLPTRFFSLQGHQVRHLRATFHAQLEFQRAAWHLGFTYWLLSTTEVLDRVFFTPIIVYLYGVFGRALGQYGMAYVIIACSFTGLVVLHFLFFMLRRQFRYICWFILYCLLSLPLYAVWFPLLAVWQSNQAEYWYDVWPRSHGQRTRWHGIIDPAVHNACDTTSDDVKKKKDEEVQGGRKRRTFDGRYESEKYEATTDAVVEALSVPRLRLTDYEILETRRVYQAAEAAFDSSFVGFSRTAALDVDTTLQQRNVSENDAVEGASVILSPPSMAQIRKGVHATRITTPPSPLPFDMYHHSSSPVCNTYEQDAQQHNLYPHATTLDISTTMHPLFFPPSHPFDDSSPYYSPSPSSHYHHLRHQHKGYHHRSSHSQSSYFAAANGHPHRSPSRTNTSVSTAATRYTHHNADVLLDGSTLPGSRVDSNVDTVQFLPSSFPMPTTAAATAKQKDTWTAPVQQPLLPPPLLLNDEFLPLAEKRKEVEDDRTSTLSITSNTFSVYTPDDMLFEDSYPEHPHSNNNNENRHPRHRIIITHQNNNNNAQHVKRR